MKLVPEPSPDLESLRVEVRAAADHLEKAVDALTVAATRAQLAGLVEESGRSASAGAIARELATMTRSLSRGLSDAELAARGAPRVRTWGEVAQLGGVR